MFWCHGLLTAALVGKSIVVLSGVVVSHPPPPPPPPPSSIATVDRKMFIGVESERGKLSPLQTNCVKSVPKGNPPNVLCFEQALRRLLDEDSLQSFPADAVQQWVEEAKEKTARAPSGSAPQSDASVIASIYGPNRSFLFQIASRELLKRQVSLEPAELLRMIASGPTQHLTLLELIVAMIPKTKGRGGDQEKKQGEDQGIAKLVADDKAVTGIDWSVVKDGGLLAVRRWARTPNFFSQVKALKRTADALTKAADYYDAPDGTLPLYLASLNSLITNSADLRPLVRKLVDWVNIYNARHAKTFQPVAGFKSAALQDGLRVPILKKRLVDVFVQAGHLPEVLSGESLNALLRDTKALGHTKQGEVSAEGALVMKELGVALNKLAAVYGMAESRSVLDDLDALQSNLGDFQSAIQNGLDDLQAKAQELRTMFLEDPSVGVDEIATNLHALLQRLKDGEARRKAPGRHAILQMERPGGLRSRGRHEIVVEVGNFNKQ